MQQLAASDCMNVMYGARVGDSSLPRTRVLKMH